ncbi:hypothetical protein [Paenibacillus cremeus]|uniref:Uncharacterized protein n=1 Tax=Paenibacillus cremeus TaxID=2163881 RepID=A0A559K6E0_9BACL|nr:hypothetical protein [Paenibacillus cremeus]TVY07705.1 hypothetical protein FPZ49_22765 [Paenibacillus cremeus]
MRVKKRALWGYAPASLQGLVNTMQSTYTDRKGRMAAELAQVRKQNEKLREEAMLLHQLVSGGETTEPALLLSQAADLERSYSSASGRKLSDEWKLRLCSRLFGLHKGKVHEFLRKMEHLHEDELALLAARVEAYRKEQELIMGIKMELLRKQEVSRSEQLGVLQPEPEPVNEPQIVHETEPVSELEIDSVPELVEVSMSEPVSEQLAMEQPVAEAHGLALTQWMEERDREADVRRTEYERHIAMLEEQAERTSKMLEELERQLEEKTAQAAEKDKDKEIEKPAELEASEEQAKLAKVVMLKPKPVLVEVQPIQAVTADGLMLQEEDREPVLPNVVASTVAGAEQLEARPSGSAFWGNVDGYMRSSSTAAEARVSPAARPVRLLAEEKPQDSRVAVQSELEAGQREAAASAAASEGASTPSPTMPPQAQSQESAALTSEIQAIRHRYIVGKRAGDTLYDAGGRLIISQGGVITADVVDAADRAGKLADLIVGMTISGLGDK